MRTSRCAPIRYLKLRSQAVWEGLRLGQSKSEFLKSGDASGQASPCFNSALLFDLDRIEGPWVQRVEDFVETAS